MSACCEVDHDEKPRKIPATYDERYDLQGDWPKRDALEVITTEEMAEYIRLRYQAQVKR